MRLRYLAPAALRDEAWLLLDGPGPRAWRWVPSRRRAERVAPPGPTARVGGSGLTWGMLRPLAVEAHAWALERDAALLDSGALVDAAAVTSGARAVRLVEARPRPDAAGAWPGPRRFAFDRERAAPLVLEERDAQGGLLRRLRQGDWRWCEGLLRPFALEVAEPPLRRATRARVAWRRPRPPAAHFDPDRFQEP